MSGDELDRFLSAGSRTGKLATVRADGRPHVAPIWFILDRDDLVFMTGANTVKGKAMLRDPRVALLVDDERPPFAFATIEGTVSISRDLDEMLPLSIAIARRYMGDDLAESTADETQLRGSCSCGYVVPGSLQRQKSQTRAHHRATGPNSSTCGTQQPVISRFPERRR
jgi:PPOX class probable F420-dependent enzyme